MDRLLEATYRVEQQHFWWKGLRAFARPLVADALASRPSPRILDCGCGTGANLVMLGEFGHASGFDLTFRGLEFARAYDKIAPDAEHERSSLCSHHSHPPAAVSGTLVTTSSDV